MSRIISIALKQLMLCILNFIHKFSNSEIHQLKLFLDIDEKTLKKK